MTLDYISYMGRIKSTLIKRTTKELIKKYPNLFTIDFEKNQELLNKLSIEKKFKNSIAGYITRLIKQKQQGK